ncbi:tape measure protein [Streptomyces sp. NPDC001407]|uniref:aggregation-promoting factor C-terminal-like domain-containing protein n=1 Tax=Streptomyces sp. NPDC001407 TaxID=3364573 RepID=UPI00367DE411
MADAPGIRTATGYVDVRPRINQAALTTFANNLVKSLDRAGAKAGEGFATAFTRAAARSSINLTPLMQRANAESATGGRRAGEAYGQGLSTGAEPGMAKLAAEMAAMNTRLTALQAAAGRQAGTAMGAGLGTGLTTSVATTTAGASALLARSGRTAGTAWGRSYYAAATDEVGNARKFLNKHLKAVENEVTASANRLRDTGQVLTRSLTTPILAIGTAVSLMGIKYADAMNTAQKRMESMGASAKDSAKSLTDLNNFAIKTPFAFDGMALAVTRIMSVGKSAGEATKEIKAFADMAAARGVQDTQTFNRALKGFTDVLSSGTVHAQDLNQLVNAGIPIYNDLAEQLYGSRDAVGKVKDAMKGGEISSQQFEKAMGKAWKRYKDSAEGAATSITGSFQNMFEKISTESSKMFGRFATAEDVAAGLTTPDGKKVKEGQFVYTEFGQTLVDLTGKIGDLATDAMPLLQDALSLVIPLLDKAIDLISKFVNWYKDDDSDGWLKTLVKYSLLAGPALIGLAAGLKIVAGAFNIVRGSVNVIMGALQGSMKLIGGFAKGLRGAARTANQFLGGVAAGKGNFKEEYKARRDEYRDRDRQREEQRSQRRQSRTPDTSNLSQANSQLSGLEAAARKVDQALDKVVLRLTQINTEKLDKIEREFESFARQVGGIESKIKGIGTEILSLDGKKTDLVAQEFTSLSSNARSSHDAVETITREMNQLNDKKTNLVVGQLDALKNNAGQAKAAVDSAADRVDHLDGRKLTNLDKEYTDFRSKVIAAKGAVDDLTSRVTALNDRDLDKIQREFGTLRAKVNDVDTSVGNNKSGLNSRIRNLNGIDLGNIKREFDGLKGSIAGADKKTGELNTSIGKVNNATGGGHGGSGGSKGRKPKAYARGGILPGYTPGRDVHLAALSGGEAVMRPEWTRAVGPQYVHVMNAAARAGGVPGVQKALGLPAFAKGGIAGRKGGNYAGWLSGPIDELRNLLDVTPFTQTIYGSAALAKTSSSLGPMGKGIGAWSNLQSKWAGGPFSVLPDKMAGWMGSKLPRAVRGVKAGFPWTTLAGLALGAIGPTASDNFMKDIWHGDGNILQRVTNFAGDTFSPDALGGMIMDLLKSIMDEIESIWSMIKGGAKLIKDLMSDPVGTAKNLFEEMKDMFTGVVQGAFDSFRDITKILDDPDEWVREAFEAFLERAKEALPNTKGLFDFANGGTVPGYSPKRDRVHARLSPGEAVLVPETARALGPRTIAALNDAGRSGDLGGLWAQLAGSLGGIPGASEGNGEGQDPAKAIQAPIAALKLLEDAIRQFVQGVAIPLWSELDKSTTAAYDTLTSTTRSFADSSRSEWDRIASDVHSSWSRSLLPDFQALGAYLSGPLAQAEVNFQSTNQSVWADVRSKVDSAWSSINGTFNRMSSGVRSLESQFSSSAGTIRTTWDQAMSFVDRATRNTVLGAYNNGAVGMMSEMAKLAGAPAPLKPLHFASGGVVPGYAPGVDRVPAVLSPGEGILRPEVVRQLGPSTILEWNRNAKATGRAFANGGIVGGAAWVKKHKDDPFAGYQEAIGKGWAAAIEPHLKDVADSFKVSGKILSDAFRKGKPWMEAKGKFWDDNTGGNAAVVRVAWDEFRKEAPMVGGSKYNLGNGEAWCADFVSYVVDKAGANKSYGNSPKGAPGSRWPAVATWNSRMPHGPLSEARPGDLLTYRGDGHINIVVGKKGNQIETIGGNESNSLKHYLGYGNTASARLVPSGGGDGKTSFSPWPGVQIDLPGGIPTASGDLGQQGYHASPGNAMGIAEALLEQKGWRQHWQSLYNLWDGESNWSWNATNRSSGAYGIPQSLPGSKMASAGSDWRDNATTQIRWGLGYIGERYGDPSKAYSFWKRNNWYANGGLVTKPTVAMVGEAGPELVLPLSRRERTEELLARAGLAQKQGHTVIVNAAPNVPTEDQIITKLRQFEMLYA